MVIRGVWHCTRIAVGFHVAANQTSANITTNGSICQINHQASKMASAATQTSFIHRRDRIPRPQHCLANAKQSNTKNNDYNVAIAIRKSGGRHFWQDLCMTGNAVDAETNCLAWCRAAECCGCKNSRARRCAVFLVMRFPWSFLARIKHCTAQHSSCEPSKNRFYDNATAAHKTTLRMWRCQRANAGITRHAIFHHSEHSSTTSTEQKSTAIHPTDVNAATTSYLLVNMRRLVSWMKLQAAPTVALQTITSC